MRIRKDELAQHLARSAGVTPAEAADQLDGIVHRILKKLRRGKPANLPGLGKLTPETRQKVRFAPPKRPMRGPR